jgi:hypothetical protein
VKRDPHKQDPNLPTINKIMKLKSFAPIVLLGLSLSMYSSLLVTHTPIAHAQVDESRKVNWENTRKLYPLIINAISSKNQSELEKLSDEMRANLDEIEKKLSRVGDGLHAKDRAWPWSDEKVNTMNALGRTRASLAAFRITFKTDPNTSPNDFINNFSQFTQAFDNLTNLYITHGRELDAMLKAFTQDCRECR